MKLKLKETSELSDLVPIKRITVNISFECDLSESIRPLRKPDGSYDLVALEEYHEFIINSLSIFDAHNFEILEEHQSPRSESEYFTLVKSDDLKGENFRFILFVRLSDHPNDEDSYSVTQKYYSDRSDTLKQPKTKSKQIWKLKEITVNNETYYSYDDALEDIDKRLRPYDKYDNK